MEYLPHVARNNVEHVPVFASPRGVVESSSSSSNVSMLRPASSVSISARVKKIMADTFETSRASALDAEANGQAETNVSAYHRAALDRFLAKEPLLFDWDRTD